MKENDGYSSKIELKRSSRRPSQILNAEFQSLIAAVCRNTPEFAEIDPAKIVISISRSKSGRKHGTWAYVTPLRYVGGSKIRQGIRRGFRGYYKYESGRIESQFPEALYLMTFLIPRFFCLSFEERIETVIHEIYHIHPEFRGDLRRFAKPHVHHGPTPRAFRLRVREIAAGLLLKCPEFREHSLLTAQEGHFENHRCHRFDIPKRIFVRGGSDELRNPDPSMFEPKFEPKMPRPKTPKRPQHPRFLERLLRGIFTTSLFIFSASATAQDFLTEDDTPAEGPVAEAPPQVSPGESFDDAILKFNFHDSLSDILPKRFLVKVQGLEEPALRPAPGENSPEIFPVKPGDVFFFAGDDPSKEWAFLQTRGKSGWVRKRYVKPIQPLLVPGSKPAVAGEELTGITTYGGTLIDGDAAIDTRKRFVDRNGTLQEIDGSHLDGLHSGFDTITTLEAGQFYTEPNPLSQRYGLIEAGDQVTFLKRDSTGKWARVRLELTGEEGWYPAGWLRVNRLSEFHQVQRFGRLGIDFDLGYGNQGNNLGFSSMLGFDTRLGNSGSSRFELGALASYWSGESLTIGTAAFSVKYFNIGVLPRYVLFNGAGNLAGALELGVIYRLPMGSLAGLDADVIAQNGLDHLLRSGFAMVFGARAYYVLSKHLQIQAGIRGHLSSTQPAYFALSGISFKF